MLRIGTHRTKVVCPETKFVFCVLNKDKPAMTHSRVHLGVSFGYGHAGLSLLVYPFSQTCIYSRFASDAVPHRSYLLCGTASSNAL